MHFPTSCSWSPSSLSPTQCSLTVSHVFCLPLLPILPLLPQTPGLGQYPPISSPFPSTRLLPTSNLVKAKGGFGRRRHHTSDGCGPCECRVRVLTRKALLSDFCTYCPAHMQEFPVVWTPNCITLQQGSPAVSLSAGGREERGVQRAGLALSMRTALTCPFFPDSLPSSSYLSKAGWWLPTACSLFEVGLAVVGAVLTRRGWDIHKLIEGRDSVRI